MLDDANLRDPKKGSLGLLALCLEKALSYLIQGKRDNERTSTSKHCGGCGGQGGSGRGGTIEEEEEGKRVGEEGSQGEGAKSLA